jgi:hypothetical protein
MSNFNRDAMHDKSVEQCGGVLDGDIEAAGERQEAIGGPALGLPMRRGERSGTGDQRYGDG